MGEESRFWVVGTVLDPASKSSEGGVGSLHWGVLAWDTGWMGNLEIRVVRCSQSSESGFPGGAAPPWAG